MRRRDFCLTSLAAPGALRGQGRFTALSQAHWEGTRLFFLETAAIVEQTAVRLLPAPLEKMGPLVRADSPGDERGIVGARGNGMLRDEKGRRRYYYSGHTAREPRGAICVAESDDGVKWTKPKLGQVRMGGEDKALLFAGACHRR